MESPILPLPELDRDLDSVDKQSKNPQQECYEDEFHWSDASNDDDVSENGETNRDGDGNSDRNVDGDGDGDGDENIDNDCNRGMMFDHEYNNEDIIRSGSSGDDDVVSRMSRHMKHTEFKYGTDGKIYFEVGQVFNDVNHFREVLKDYTIQRGFALRKIYNEKRRIKAVCKQEGCPFHIYAALMVDKKSYQIKINENTHTCLRVYNNPNATAPWIAKKMGEFIRSHKGSCVKPLDSELRRVHYLELGKRKLYRANRIATGMTIKEHADSFAWLYKYTHIIQVTNPGSMIQLRVIRENVPETPKFKRYFLSFVAQKKGFLEGCRHFIGIDGCHLKGYYGGVLLSAVSMDANSGIFPLAICICEVENKDSWGFFLSLLHDFIGDVDHVTFMSDRQKGILNALEFYWPYARSRYCARHVYANFRKKFPGVHLRNLFWKVSRASNRVDFVMAMGMVREVDEDAYQWILENDPNQWSRHAFDPIAKSDHITNNMSECFNAWLGEGRELPILSLLELYRRRVMKRLQFRFQAGAQWTTTLPPVVHRKINKLLDSSINVSILHAGSDEFEVIDKSVMPSRTHTLVLGNQVCDCGMWQISGVPCVHALCCLRFSNVTNFEEYVDEKLRIAMYMQTYSYMIHPVPDKASWPDVSNEKLWPPYKHAKSGRPRKARKRDPLEEPKNKKVSTLRCSICKVMGHNKRSCKDNKTTQKKTFVPTMTAPSSRARFVASSRNASSSMPSSSQRSSSSHFPSSTGCHSSYDFKCRVDATKNEKS